MTARYKKIDCVTVCHDGLSVELKLQQRLDVGPYHCLCWRTRLQLSPDKSRRFYSSSNFGFWTIPVAVAINIMRQAEDRGFVGFQYDDLRIRDGTRWSTIIDSRELNAGQLHWERGTIICNNGEPEWGNNPLFIICHSEDSVYGAWREIMIVDTKREFCTFRCTTTNTYANYKMGIFADRLEGLWRLDNAMQDAAALSMRELLRMLEEISA